MHIDPPLKTFGGKFPLASKLHQLAPPHIHRVHAFGGGLGEFWNWPYEGVSEIVNDLSLELTNFWRVLQQSDTYAAFERIASAVPFSRYEWEAHKAVGPIIIPNVSRAISFFVRCRQSRAGQFDSFAPPSRARVRRGMNEQVSAWLTAVDGLPEIFKRLRRVFIEHIDALVLIPREDTSDTLFYLDPPYVHDTRTTKDAYEYEMTMEQHKELLRIICQVVGKVMLSGYHCDLYDSCLSGWRCVEFDRANSAAGGESKRRMTECVWMNYPIPG